MVLTTPLVLFRHYCLIWFSPLLHNFIISMNNWLEARKKTFLIISEILWCLSFSTSFHTKLTNNLSCWSQLISENTQWDVIINKSRSWGIDSHCKNDLLRAITATLMELEVLWTPQAVTASCQWQNTSSRQHGMKLRIWPFKAHSEGQRRISPDYNEMFASLKNVREKRRRGHELLTSGY